MVPSELLRKAIDQLDKWNPAVATNVSWVNWRKGYQVKMNWYDGAGLACFLDFGTNSAARDAVLQAVFKRFSPEGCKPKIIDGHGWRAHDYSVRSKEFICLNDVVEIATAAGFQFTVLYVQECVSARPAFETMGIPLVPGEMGKEWVGGAFVPYSCPIDQNL